jgi:menaquinone-dependent protoporphyrinogen oxidase
VGSLAAYGEEDVTTAILVAYGTSEGQTAKIADGLRDRGHTADAVDVIELDQFAVDTYDAVLVGASIHRGRHQSAVRTFVSTHCDALATLPTGFFQVCLTAVSPDEERRAAAAQYVHELVETTGWHPDRIAIFGGALRYSKYGFLKRVVLKRIAKDVTGDTDTTRDYEYTDWDEVDRFTEEFAVFVEERLGVAGLDPTLPEPWEADGD